MSAEYSPASQCKGKSTFGSKAEAKRWTRRYVTEHPGADLLDAYRCPHCGSFHLGHRRQHVRDRLRGDAA